MLSANRPWRFRLQHMLDAIRNIADYITDMDETRFRSEKQTVHAVVWNLTVLGEAARGVPDEVVVAYPQIPWPQMRGIRNRIVHGYDRIDLEIIWEVATVELPQLVPLLEQVQREAVE